MPVAVAIGAAPAVIYAATAPMPRGVDEMLLAGFINKKSIYMTKCLTIDIDVPAEAEFVLEGYVEPNELREEGPFGDHTGYYSLADDYPVFHVTAMTHRKAPVYNATLVGKPPMEDCFLAKATERIFLPMLQAVMPEIRDYCLPIEGVFHNIVIVSVDKEYCAHAHKVMNGLWGQGQMSFCKAIVVVDKEIDPSNSRSVIKELITKLDISSDIILTKGILDVLDHSSPFPNFGSKIGIDLTKRFIGEPSKTYPSVLKRPVHEDELKERLLSKVGGVLECRPLLSDFSDSNESVNRILAVTIKKDKDKSGRDFTFNLLEVDDIEMFNIIILFDKDIDLFDASLMLWKLFNNVDPQRDMFFQNNRLVIDACKKSPIDGHNREWPDELTFDF